MEDHDVMLEGGRDDRRRLRRSYNEVVTLDERRYSRVRLHTIDKRRSENYMLDVAHDL